MGEPLTLMRGCLLFAKKASASSSDWKGRYYILRPMEGNFVACELSEKSQPGSPVGLLQLYQARVADIEKASSHSSVADAASGLFPFQITPASGKPWFLASKSAYDRDSWKTAIEDAIRMAPSETEADRHKQIDKLILQEKKALSKSPELKLLLLGPGHSGKSTILKQMKILHCNGFLPGELEFYKGLCRSNILDITNQLLDATKTLGFKLSPQIESTAASFQTYYRDVHSRTNAENGVYTASEDVPDEVKATSYAALSAINSTPRGRQEAPVGQVKSIVVPPQFVSAIDAIWREPCIQEKTLAHGPEFHLPDSTVYFMSDVARIMDPEYTPTPQDILRSRHRTTAVHETVFLVDDTKFRIIDVGGQRGERKKWVSFFDDVTAVLFVAAISEYDQNLREDDETNRLHEALTVFENICKLKSFANVPIILFLNKDDIFREKIKKVPLSNCFPKYDGGASYNSARNYIQDKFEHRKGNKDRIIYPHVICATDTESFRKVAEAVQDIILTNALRDAHL